jgi:[ribosomal protein S5]-alanine N-acetyltransferase
MSVGNMPRRIQVLGVGSPGRTLGARLGRRKRRAVAPTGIAIEEGQHSGDTSEMDPSATVVTGRLQLEPIVADHAEVLFEVIGDPVLYEHLDERPPESVDALRERYRLLEARTSPDRSEHWLNWAVRRIEDGRYVGVVQATVSADASAWIAYVLSRGWWGHGYATEATAAIVALLEAEWGVFEFHAAVDKANGRSIAVLHRLGFVGTGGGDGGDLHFVR